VLLDLQELIEIDRYNWLIYRYQPKWPILSASVGIDKALLYSSLKQTTCARKHNKASQDSILQQH